MRSNRPRVALAAAPWQRSPGSRFVCLRSRRPRPPNGFARWLPVVAIAPPWSPGGASRAGSPSAVVRCSPIDRVFLASAQLALTCLGSRCLANRLAPGGQPRRARGRSPSARSVPCRPCRARPIRTVDTRVTNFPAGGGVFESARGTRDLSSSVPQRRHALLV